MSSRMKSSKSRKSVPPAPWVPHSGAVVEGRWRLTHRLGKGGMGEVWEAEQVHTGQVAALKFLVPELADNPYARTDLYLEGATSNLVDRAARATPPPRGPGAVEVRDDGQTPDGAPFLVMDRLRGVPLESLVSGGRRLPPEAVEEVVDQTLRVLNAAHQQHVVHRDIKPENLFVTEAGDVVVMDFGLAQRPGDHPHPGHFVGTPTYAPPEQALGLPATPASDVYGVGTTAYRLLAGQVPVSPDAALAAPGEYLKKFSVEDQMKILGGLAQPTYFSYEACLPPIRRVAPDVPPDLARVVDRAVACDPAVRYRSANAMREALEKAVDMRLAGEGRASANGHSANGGVRVAI